MSANVVEVDLAQDGVIISFSDGTSAFFREEFLYAHRSDDRNTLLPDEPENWSAVETG